VLATRGKPARGPAADQGVRPISVNLRKGIPSAFTAWLRQLLYNLIPAPKRLG
jgi:hypothetical protein